jgi:hypothetical protein
MGSITEDILISFQILQEASGLCVQSDKYYNVSELVLWCVLFVSWMATR